MLKINRLSSAASAADLFVEDTGVVSVYRKLQPDIEKVYWRANPKENNALVSLDISDGGEVLNFGGAKKGSNFALCTRAAEGWKRQEA